MSVITIATSKGGAGKTTLAAIIAGGASDRSLSVAAIDADYNHSLSDWVRRFEKYPIDVHHELRETNIVPLALELEENHDVVVIDTAGAATQATVFAIGCADCVLIPVQLSSSDVVEAVKTMRLVESAAKMTKRDIPVRVVLTDYQPHTNIAAHTESELASIEAPVMQTRLTRLVGFKEMTFNGEVPRTGLAGERVRAFLDELVALGALPETAMKLAS